MSASGQVEPRTRHGTSPSPSAPLVGRDADVAAITNALAQAGAGTARLVLVEGEAGIGKSRVIDEALARTASSGTVLRAAGHQLERERPFGLISDALGLERLMADATSRDPEGGVAALVAGSSSPELRFHVIDAVLDRIERRAMRGAVTLVLDDLHWADASSIVAIDQILRRLADRPVGIVAAARPAPRLRDLERLVEACTPPMLRRVHLEPLDEDAVQQLAEDLLGAAPDPAVRAELDAAAGNPFFVAELLAALTEEGSHPAIDAGDARLRKARARPRSLRLTILRRIGFMAHDAVDVLRVASVLGSRFALDDLALALDRPASQLLEELDEPMRAGVLVPVGERFAFRHDLVRDALYLDLPEASRRGLHLQIGRALAAAARAAPDVARHFLAGAQPGDLDAIGWLRRAASDAMAHAPNVAADLLDGAAALADGDGALRDEILVELSTALLWSGRIDDGRLTLERLVDRPHDPAVEGAARLGLIQMLIVGGRPTDAVGHFEALDRAPAVPGWQRARALTDAAMARMLSGDVTGAEADARQALGRGNDLEDDPSICGALCVLSWVANLAGRTDEAARLGREAVALASTSPQRATSRRYPHSYIGVVLMDHDELDEGRAMFTAGRRTAEALGDVWPLPIHHFGMVLADLYAGRYEDARAELATAVSVASECENEILVVWSLAVGAQLALHRDDLATATAQVEAGDARVQVAGPGLGYDWLLWSRALLQEATGDTTGALTTLQEAWDLAETLGIVSQRRLMGPDLVRLARLAGQGAITSAVAAAMAEAAHLSSAPSARAAALRCQGLATGDPGPLLEAVAIFREGPRRGTLAVVCEEAADLLGQAGRGPEARALMTEAIDLHDRCGSVRGHRRAEAGLRALGGKRGARGRRQRPSVGWGALTDTERNVTLLAAEGLTNPEIGQRLFISRRTVETHLSHVFAKLGISSRVALAGVVARQATPADSPAG